MDQLLLDLNKLGDTEPFDIFPSKRIFLSKKKMHKI